MPELTPAERAVAVVLLRDYDSEFDADHLTPADFAVPARAVLAAAAPHIEAAALREVADHPVIPKGIAAWLRRRANKIAGGSDG